ncbi:MAG: hypothetical protein LLF76_04130 [Planctomycetaceae bacterium]|nr:hypothetical protein [Planctomycetaceae bacterium]
MIMQIENPVSVLHRHLEGKRPLDGTVLSSAALLAERLEQLKTASPMFAAVAFSPQMENLLTPDLQAVN